MRIVIESYRQKYMYIARHYLIAKKLGIVLTVEEKI